VQKGINRKRKINRAQEENRQNVKKRTDRIMEKVDNRKEDNRKEDSRQEKQIR